MNDTDLRAAAAALSEAEAKCAPIAPLVETWPQLGLADAYAIQRLQVMDKVAAGAVIRGHKVGLSSAAMQRMLGVDQPDFGHLLDTMFVDHGHTIDTRQLCQPKAEAEVAFVMGEPLAGPGCTVADVLRATAFVCPSLEIIDSRVRDWKISLIDTVSDNASSARVVLGARATSLRDLELPTIGCVLHHNGVIAETGAAAAVLGNPAVAVAWLANMLHSFGMRLEPGHVVVPGACTRAVDVCAGDFVRADFHELGSVSVRFT